LVEEKEDAIVLVLLVVLVGEADMTALLEGQVQQDKGMQVVHPYRVATAGVVVEQEQQPQAQEEQVKLVQ
jgi:hypothetical protein